ncbi:MAG: Na+/H+ antiporter NhaC family protein [Bradymonadia bacterium]
MKRWGLLAFAALLIGALPWLPVDESTVRHHTVSREVRGALAQMSLLMEAHTPLTLNASPKDAESARKVVDARRVDDTEVGDPVEITITDVGDDRVKVKVSRGDKTQTTTPRLGDWRGVIPPLVALLLAVIFRRVIPALFIAIWAGVWAGRGGDPFTALWAVFSETIAPVLQQSFSLYILGFTLALVGMISVVSRIGGTRGLVDALSGLAKGPRSTQAVTGLMGLTLFFDDYANTVVVGTTARGLTDSRRISREKLAYIVDSTSAPVAGVAIVSTWIGYEVGLFDSMGPELLGVPGLPQGGYAIFFEILAMRFYCLFALALVFCTAFTGRDLGAMYHAERRARRGDGVRPATQEPVAEMPTELKAGVKPKARNAVIPLGVVLVLIGVGLAQAGGGAIEGDFEFGSLDHWRKLFSAASFEMPGVLLRSALVGSVVALVLAMGQRILGPLEALKAYGQGVRTLAPAAAVLILAWSIKAVCDDLSTGLTLVALVEAYLPVVILPLAVFLLSGLVAFATGTSWGTMALMLPVAVPLSIALSGEGPVVLACLAAVLDGAIWGDHCSPISDTTVLSSTASGCPHLAHVRTQIPYATLAMMVAGGVGYLGTGAGLPVLWALPLGVMLMVAGLYIFGRSADQPVRE